MKGKAGVGDLDVAGTGDFMCGWAALVTLCVAGPPRRRPTTQPHLRLRLESQVP